METLKTLLEKHPEWADLPIVVYTEDNYQYVGCSAMVYEDSDEDSRVVVFTGN